MHTIIVFKSFSNEDVDVPLYKRNILHQGNSIGSIDGISLHEVQSSDESDLAQETLHEDYFVMNTTQTTPWFDPRYLASGRSEV